MAYQEILAACSEVEGRSVTLVSKGGYSDGGSRVLECPKREGGVCKLNELLCRVVPGGNDVVRGPDSR